MGVIEFWKLAKKHPFTAGGLVLLLVVVTVGWEILQPRILRALDPPPFANLAGLYSGSIEGNDFYLCLKVYGHDVLGTMSWKGDDENAYYVDYEGKVGKDQVNLNYSRNRKAPYPDHGVAVITPPQNGQYKGYWTSTAGNTNRQELSLTKIQGKSCKLISWNGVN